MSEENIIPISKIFDFDDDGKIVFLERKNKSGRSILPKKMPEEVKKKIREYYPDIIFIEKDINFGPLIEQSGEPGMVFISKLVDDLVALADSLDKQGFVKEADHVDLIIKKAATGELPRGSYCEICGDTKNFEFKKKQRMYLCPACSKDTPAKVSQDKFIETIRSIQKKEGHEMDKSEEMTLRNSFYPDYKASKISSVAEYWESCSS